MEDVVTNWESVNTFMMRVCPCCLKAARWDIDLKEEMKNKRLPCEQCGFVFPYLDNTPSSFALYTG